MLINLQLNCDLNANLYLVFGLRFGVVGHFLYIVRWEEQLQLSTMVTFPPVVNRMKRTTNSLFFVCLQLAMLAKYMQMNMHDSGT